MNQAMEVITERLAEEISCYRELLEVVNEEREIILHGEAEGLFATSEKKVALSKRLVAHQEARREAMAVISPDPETPVKLIELTPHLPAERQAPFRAAVTQAARMAQDLVRINDSNKGYLEEALNTVEHIIGLLTKDPKDTRYGQRPGQKVSRPRILAKEV